MSTLRQKLATLRQRREEQAAQTLLTTLGIAPDYCTIALPNTPPAKLYEQWLTQQFPWQCGQILWQAPPPHCLPWKTYEEAATHLSTLCQTHALGNPIVHIIWFATHNPTLTLPLNQVKQAAADIFAQDWDTWIINLEANWCIECHHEGTLCYGTGTSANP